MGLFLVRKDEEKRPTPLSAMGFSLRTDVLV